MSSETNGDPPGVGEKELAEGLHPELSEDTFQIGTMTFQLRMLPLLYERKAVNLLGDIVQKADQLTTTEVLDQIMGKLPQVVAIIVYSQGGLGVDPKAPWNPEKLQEIAAWVEQTACSMDLVEIIGRQLQKNKLADRLGELSAQGIVNRLAGSLSTLSTPASSKPSPAAH